MNKEKQSVLHLIKKYKTTDVYQICDYLNVDVSFKALGNLRGFYRYLRRNKFIVINKNLSAREKRFVCSHELGHLILHKGENRILMDINVYKPSRYENEANKFAIYLILESLENWQKNNITLQDISRYTNLPINYLQLLNI